MMMLSMKKPSYSWWFDSHNSPRRSAWLQSTLTELDEKTKAMLKLIEEDADSFAQRAEMYYKKRPELVNMVEDFYRAHRSLAERFDQLKSESGARLVTPLGSPYHSKYSTQKITSPMQKSYDSYSENFDSEESGESEVDDPEQEEEVIQVDAEREEEEVSCEISASESEVMRLREEIERLKVENRIQKDKLMEKDEEKREVIRQLSLAIEVLKEENATLKKNFAKEPSKKRSPFEFSKLKEAFSMKLFNGFVNPQTSVVAL
ncbi:PREDICTED: protein NETWORKED 3C [Nelumbo nucifera]|uniref:Protein NETWORKED 3C n=2 Tax=Nelumbo nucifera TaxID=4432 RepID=A0A1U7ZBV9_NELNU|nr:PREDICTED: protein NETWORKED 3C [Nelumbo nucifera]XP_010245356.1 PREDICTED: protein NETWORKED 3C [Nelumbo nucifera]DAD37926.1 TPA_asm: hypothetical protein HUJ06_008567 [Nelumbo nucifera]